MVVFFKIRVSFIFVFSGAVYLKKESQLLNSEISLRNHVNIALFLLDLDFYCQFNYLNVSRPS